MKRVFSVLLSVALLLSLIPVGAVEFSFSAEAATSGIYTYQITNFYTTITRVSTSASGHIAIPAELGNCPVTGIAKEAFSSCRNVTSVDIPDTVTVIGEDVFYNSGIYRNQSNWVDGLLYVDGCLVDAQTDLAGACTVREGTRLIAERVFSNCTALTAVTVADSVLRVGMQAFAECPALTAVTLGKGVEYIGYGAFRSCPVLKSLTVAAGNTTYRS
ncbi:MAG: leucine-rich repeat domain-containing protein, partial [Ruminococcaceae bacterium]|nr:leucine-rich repeat domain-containing protein [Oscillospiraceae bacterium]